MEKRGSLITSLCRYALAGAGASFLLWLIECIDLNIQLTSVFETFYERLLFSSYFGLNLIGGSLIGLLVGLAATSASWVAASIQRVIAGRAIPGSVFRIGIYLTLCAIGAVLLKQQAHIHGYVVGLIREAEKIPFLSVPLLNHERSTSYLTLTGLIIACSLVHRAARASASFNPLLKVAWLAALLVLIAAAYFVDSRFQVELYQYSLHRSMFLLSLTLAMALTAGSYLSSALLRSFCQKVSGGFTKWLLVSSVVASSAFTFFHFGSNQNLKTQVMLRTTQTREYVKLAQWALDFDRDGYSARLDGGDADDGRADVNPGQPESIGDGIDNNCMGGDLTTDAINDWRRERLSLRSSPDPSARRLNIVYIFIDALRPDHLGAYGYLRKTSPNIDRLAARSSVFENAFTPAPDTYEAFPKFMQGSYWDGHYPTWTEVLARNGYNNLLFPRRVSTQKRYIKGMKLVHNERSKGLSDTIDLAIDLLGKAPSQQPFCAFLYATDPHWPYLKHPEFDFGSSNVDLYDGEIAFADSEFGRLFDWMERTGRLDSTMIVIMADHAESMGERGVYLHSSQLYNEQVQIPMIVYVPGLAPRRIPDYVSSVDLGPSILNTVGLEYPEQYAGVSLLPLMRGEEFAHPPVFAEHIYSEASPFVQRGQNVHPERRKYMMIAQDGYKLIYNRNSHTFELFDLKADPGEIRNLYDHSIEKSDAMKRLLGRFIDIVLVSRPWDADETKHSFGRGVDEDSEM
jgi:arylsulfatase A-like enzyme